MSAPISQIVASVQEIAAGNFSTPVIINSHDEIANLAENINRMRISLAESIEALTQSNEELQANNDEIKALYSQIAARNKIWKHRLKNSNKKNGPCN